MNKQELIEKDKKYVWHPDTQMKDYEKESPIIIERGKGIYVWDIDGNKYIDAIASWWVNTLGHSNPRLNKALCNQVEKIEHVLLGGFSHVPAIELAEELVNITAPSLTKVFFSDNGSTATEVAIKMAFQYWQQVGRPTKTKFVAMEQSYHGDTLGSVSVGGIDTFYAIFKPLLFEKFEAKSPYCYRCPMGCDKQTCECECINSAEEIFKYHHEEIAAMIVEPLVQGACGMRMYPPKYLKKLRALCDKYEILLIHDEVAMGFGRTGKMFAYEHAGIEPDFVCLSKGITAGYLPLAVTITNDKIYKGFYSDDFMKAFFHGHSYTGNPLAAAIAVENLKIFKEEKIIESLQPKIEYMKKETQRLYELNQVGDVRQTGMIVAIELVKDRETKTPFDASEKIGKKIYYEALKLGAILRPLGDTIYFIPPYVITKNEIKQLVDIAYNSIKNVFDD
ncbi:MAG: adenosylmethionine--8-amino-7-oxononanoate transaminase [Candidatus Gastranaerophilales bacterium]|nr:adenosylmethionine--8-amino-7-oxononanoate transaminase [Candidatus Gastranaerophilales bacterium]